MGGIREKIVAAARYGITEIVMPAANEKDLFFVPLPPSRLLISGSGPGPDQLQYLGIGRRHPAFPIQCSENQAGCCCHISPFSS